MKLMISSKDSVKVVNIQEAELLSSVNGDTISVKRDISDRYCYHGKIKCDSHESALKQLEELYDKDKLKVTDINYSETLQVRCI